MKNPKQARRVLWCRWPLAPLNECGRLCLKAVAAGKEYCPEHLMRFPIWPQNAPATPAAPAPEALPA